MPSFTFNCVVEISANDEQEAKKFLFKLIDRCKLNENITDVYSSVDDELSENSDEKIYDIASKEFNLPTYNSHNYKQFVIDMYNNEIALQHYNGRNFYSSPAVVVKNIQDVLSNTKIKCQ